MNIYSKDQKILSKMCGKCHNFCINIVYSAMHLTYAHALLTRHRRFASYEVHSWHLHSHHSLTSEHRTNNITKS